MYLAPAGMPVTLRDIANGVAAASPVATAAVTAALRQVSGQPHVGVVSSGRAAMTIILRAMREVTPGRDEVIIPAYTCYSVPAAIERAGLKPRLCDVDPSTLGMDPDALSRCDFSRALAVISANLYGLPNDLASIEAICRARGVHFLDDAAQALGATGNSLPVGAFGDAGLYSFDKGKVISTMQGGAIVCRDSMLAAKIAEAVRSLPAGSWLESTGNLMRLLVYSVFLRPTLYGVIRGLPFTGLGHTRYETRYPVSRLSRVQTGVAAALLRRVGQLNSARRGRAAEYDSVLSNLHGIALPRRQAQSEAVFVRYPIRVLDAPMRSEFMRQLDRAGIGASASYPLSLADVPEVVARIPAVDRACPGARELARTIVTLPTHAYCPPSLAARVGRLYAACQT
jgi:dTDP-4-amino-4,6-dideoxygalactose transaminase